MPVLSGPQLAMGDSQAPARSASPVYERLLVRSHFQKSRNPPSPENLLQKPFSQQELAVRMRETLVGKTGYDNAAALKKDNFAEFPFDDLRFCSSSKA